MLNQSEIIERAKILGFDKNKKWVSVSAKTGENIKQLKELIKEVLENQQKPRIEKNTFREEQEKIFGN